MVLSDKVASGRLAVLDKLEAEEYKTKVFDKMLKGFEKIGKNLKEKADKKDTKTQKHKNTKTRKQKSNKVKRSVLIVSDKKDEKVKYSGRNLAGAKIINLENINILDLLKFRDLVLTKGAIEKIEKIYKK
ncbi:50S ribosomal protein L4 [Candidatus Falkowbacteria bacterium CG11_big_fil_rev_8_21_14_0_20_39_10]|uniref:Large ribosomal subunit protein uL4 n=1 Tax=Candidatus Falkowbacteria bacterium CG11_big_fil_rev_8_21_14_0_20_39_10 TaxID=1974570 RepID=A0A2M6K9G2_9BACT|nr:MAG: 50S ribosomal protein L4 [Candidatus Falkowbacteria bacterium CG11_big_fil_rev_8_21_14_0_20_39_10]